MRRIGLVGDALRQRDAGRQRDRGRAGGRAEKRAAVEEQMLWGGAAFGHFPAAAANDVHGPDPSGSLREVRPAGITGKSRCEAA